MTENKKTGIYIHIPFCVKKCNYCAFLSFAAEGSPRKEYTDALVKEIELRAGMYPGESERTIDTVYIGGGTPSVLDISQMRDIMHAVGKHFRLSDDAEITIEANPATLGRKDGVMLAKLQAYKYMGFNRLSMGVQAMDNNRLHYLGRIHTAENVARDMDIIRRKGFDNVNLDLIFSVPGTTEEDSLYDLERILAFKPEHISCYSLQIEENTPFYKMAESGELKEVDDETDRAAYHEICRILKNAGYEHYEISNFARMPEGAAACGFGDPSLDPKTTSPYRSRHNSLYWDLSDYIAFGLGASGFAEGVRYKNTSDMDEYFSLINSGKLPAAEAIVNTQFDNISEAVFTGLRRREGISYYDAAAAWLSAKGGQNSVKESPDQLPAELRDPEGFFWDIFSEARAVAEDYAARGLLIMDDTGLRLTEAGVDISNSIMSLFV